MNWEVSYTGPMAVSASSNLSRTVSLGYWRIQSATSLSTSSAFWARAAGVANLGSSASSSPPTSCMTLLAMDGVDADSATQLPSLHM